MRFFFVRSCLQLCIFRPIIFQLARRKEKSISDPAKELSRGKFHYYLGARTENSRTRTRNRIELRNRSSAN